MLRKTLVGAAAASLTVVAVASMPALAADHTLTVDCHTDTELSANPGDTVVVVMGPGCTPGIDWIGNRNATQNPTGAGFLSLVSYDPLPNPNDYGTYPSADAWYAYQTDENLHVTTTLVDRDGANNPLQVGSILMIMDGVWVVRYAGPVSGPTDEGTPIADVIQQVGAPAGGCDTITDPSLNWGGVTSRGWTSSWAQWANDGKGGSVCTRTLHYDNGWTVAPTS